MELINNTTKTLRDDLAVEIKEGSRLSVAAACFSIYAFQELKKELQGIEELRFIFTSPTFTTEKAKKEKREFYIPRLNRERSLYGTEFEVKLRNELTQKAIAKECAEWIRKKVTFKSNVTNENITYNQIEGEYDSSIFTAEKSSQSFAFHWMKDHKYLSVAGFNTVFPIYEYEEDDILYGIYKNSIDIIQEEIILPTNTPYEFKRINEIYVPLWGVIVDIFNDSDLRKLTGNRNVSWLAKEFSTEAYADIRRFLNRNFNLQTLEWKDLVNEIDATFLEQKSVAWIADLMSKIESYCIKRPKNDGHYIDATKIPFVRVASGKHICARDEFGHLQVYLNNPDIAKYRMDYQFVRNEDIRSFYQRALLIPEYNIEQETIENILPKYETQNVKFKTSNPMKENIEDLKTIKDAIYTNRSILDMLADKYIVTDGKNWYRPSELYIYSGDVRSGYSLVRDFVSFKFLASGYFDDTVLSIKLDEAFFRKIGCNSGIRVLETSKEDYLNAVLKYQGKQKKDKLRFGIFNKTYISSKINWAFCYEGFEDICSQLENDIRTEEEKLKVKRLKLQSAMNDRKQAIYGTERGWQYKVLEILQKEPKGKSIAELINSNKEWNGQDIICQQVVDELIALDLVEEVWLNGQKGFKKAEELAFYDI